MSLELFSYFFNWWSVYCIYYTLFDQNVQKPILNRLVTNSVSFSHSTVVTLSALKLVFFFDLEETHKLYLWSYAYFAYDLIHCFRRRENLLIGHHIGTMLLYLATLCLNNPDYYFYTTLMLFFGEITAIIQHVFFSLKLVFGKAHEHEFNERYTRMFETYVNAFGACRIVVIPALIFMLLGTVKEMWYLITFGGLSTGLIIGSFYWYLGQRRYLTRMRLMTNEMEYRDI